MQITAMQKQIQAMQTQFLDNSKQMQLQQATQIQSTLATQMKRQLLETAT